MLDNEKEGIENKQYILKIKDLLELPNVKQNTSLKDLYTFDVSRKIYELMASGFTIDVDPNISEEIGVWGIFRYLNVVHSKKDDAMFLVVEGFKPPIIGHFNEPFTYISGIYKNFNNNMRINYFIEQEFPASKVYTALITVNDEEISGESKEGEELFVQCVNKMLNDLKDSVPDNNSTKKDFNTKFPSLNREWLSKVENMDTNIHML